MIQLFKRKPKETRAFDEILEAIEEPELKDYVNNLLLRYNLSLMSEVVSGSVSGNRQIEIARNLSRQEARTAEDKTLEKYVFKILMAYIASKE